MKMVVRSMQGYKPPSGTFASIPQPGPPPPRLYQISPAPLVPLIPPPVPLVPDRSRFIFESGTPVTA